MRTCERECPPGCRIFQTASDPIDHINDAAGWNISLDSSGAVIAFDIR
jgi:hypothetical protein